MKGVCECGCGQPAPIASKTNAARGWVKGEPLRFIHGHAARGRNNGKWSGGRHRSKGYIKLRRPNHPRADSRGYVYEHILVAEAAVGRLLPVTAPVHHVNEQRDDNRPANLVICEDDAYHKLLHRRQRALDESGHADWLKCRFCKQYDAPQRLYVNPRGFGQHRECARDYERRRSA